MKTLWDLLGVGKRREADHPPKDTPSAVAPPPAEPPRQPASKRRPSRPRQGALPVAPAEAQRSPGSATVPDRQSPGRCEGGAESLLDLPTASAPQPRNGHIAKRARSADQPLTMAARYEALTRQMLREHDVRVRKWRSSMSGCAWEVYYASGRISRLIEAPRPKGPMSCAIFLHEIGHHAIGFGRYRPRCLEEYHAWRFAIEQMERHGIKVTDGVRKRMDESMRYAVDKARRRGLRQLPAELARWSTEHN